MSVEGCRNTFIKPMFLPLPSICLSLKIATQYASSSVPTPASNANLASGGDLLSLCNTPWSAAQGLDGHHKSATSFSASWETTRSRTKREARSGPEELANAPTNAHRQVAYHMQSFKAGTVVSNVLQGS
ncbi:hypothetical protein B566_EDAN007233 [Ephemera danica]|nr:hypothetical protein B566_EDAN007233 [Ephemera danica]